MRWKDGAPKQLYILVIKETGAVLTFERKEYRTFYVKDRKLFYVDETYVFRTYIQKEM